MGRIVLIGGTKGGSGKTTVATNLAVYLAHLGARVILLDTDKQSTSTKWWERRSNPELNPEPLPKIYCQQSSGNVYQAALDLSQLYDFVLIDAGGVDSRELRTAMVAADRFYIPLKASQFDLESLESLCEIIPGAKDQNPELQVYGFLCQAPTNSGSERMIAKTMLSEYPDFFLFSDSEVFERKVYRDAGKMGRGVIEMGNSQAKAEIQLLAQEVFNVE